MQVGGLFWLKAALPWQHCFRGTHTGYPYFCIRTQIRSFERNVDRHVYEKIALGVALFYITLTSVRLICIRHILKNIVHVIWVSDNQGSRNQHPRGSNRVSPAHLHTHLKSVRADSDSSAQTSHRTQSCLNVSNLPALVVSVSLFPISFPDMCR